MITLVHLNGYCLAGTNTNPRSYASISGVRLAAADCNHPVERCNWCKYSKAEWQVDCDVNINDMLWDINGINFQVDCNVTRGFTDARMRGVRSSPKSLIPFSRIIFSGLHASIGIGNRIIDHLEEFIDVDRTKNSNCVHQKNHQRTTSNISEI